MPTLHATVLFLGGLIGAGLFVGSGTVILTAGPGVLLSYCVAGLILLVILRLLARMRSRMPHAVFITDFVHAGLGERGAWVAARIYWWFWVLLVALEALAGANILFPEGGGLEAVLAEVVVVIGIAALSPRVSHALTKFEIGFSSIKVAVLVAFMALVLSRLSQSAATPRVPTPWHPMLAGHSGLEMLLAGVLPAFFSLAGIEIVQSVAHESLSSQRMRGRANVLIGIRVFCLYVISIALVLSVVQWGSVRPGYSPFVLSLQKLGHARAGVWLNAVVLVAVVSTLNSALAVCSSLGTASTDARERSSPRARCRVRAVVCALAILVAAAWWPDRAYAFLVIVASVLLTMVYVLFVLSVRVLTRASPGLIDASPRMMSVDRWLCGLLVAAMSAALLAATQIPQLRMPLGSALGGTALLAVVARFTRRSP